MPPAGAAGPPAPAAAAMPLRHPAMLFAAAVAALCAIVSVSYRLYDTDLWTLLAHGRAIATLHGITRENLWTWPGYGTPDTGAPWWLFRVLAWWLWSAGGVSALFAWRWLSTLAAFGLLWAAARRMGARGLLPLVTLTLCVLAYRIRTDVRPETLAAVLFAAVAWLLESVRHAPDGGPGPAPADRARRLWWLAPIALVWVNTHISWYLWVALLGAHLADTLLSLALARRAGAADDAAAHARRARGLALAGLAALAVSFVNPVGWRALAQPFQFAFGWRGEPLYRSIGELHPLVWSANLRNGLPLLMAGWPALILWRALRGVAAGDGPRRRRFDLAEALLCAFFTAAALSSQRFLGTYALAAAPFVARDAAALVAARRPGARAAGAWPRALATAALCVAMSLPEWTRPELPLGIALDLSTVPVAAADFMRDHGVRGRGFTPLHYGGYLAWRFWPERDRLPFMSTQPEDTPRADRVLYARAFTDPEAWEALDARRRFDYVVLDRDQDPGDRLPDFLDADPRWVTVFADDAAEVLVRVPAARGERTRLQAVADTFAYRYLPAGRAERERFVQACTGSLGLRVRMERELERQAASSPWNGRAHHLLGVLVLMDGRSDAARAHLERALERLPLLPRVHEMLGMIALEQGRPRDAVRELGRERALHGARRGLDLRLGSAWRRLGDLPRARAAWQRALEAYPDDPAARDSLAALDAGR